MHLSIVFQEPCDDHHDWCNTSPGWPGPDYCDFSPEVPRFCRKMCGLCGKSVFVCGGVCGGAYVGGVGWRGGVLGVCLCGA